MIKLLVKYIILLLHKTSIMVGGQAVINGVMMRVPGAYATAVRTSAGLIKVQSCEHQSKVEKFNISKIPIVRGFIHLIDSMQIGYKTLDWSAKISEKDSEPTNKLIDSLMTFLSIIFAITIFMGIPYYLTELSLKANSDNNIIFNLIAGALRMTIFLLYLLAISFIKDIKILFQYHGAEHKVVYNFESGKKLNINNSKNFSTQHPRCGTSFMFIIMIVTVITYSFIDTSISYIFNINLNIFTRIILHLIFLPIVAGAGYEVLKFLSKMQKYYFFKLLSKPGLWLQNITTNEPTEDQLEVSLTALNAAFNYDVSQYEGKKHIADAIG